MWMRRRERWILLPGRLFSRLLMILMERITGGGGGGGCRLWGWPPWLTGQNRGSEVGGGGGGEGWGLWGWPPCLTGQNRASEMWLRQGCGISGQGRGGVRSAGKG